jgi:hypothetical protein
MAASVRTAPESDKWCRAGLGQFQPHAPQQTAVSFDHFVARASSVGGYGEAEHSGRLEADGQLDFG